MKIEKMLKTRLEVIGKTSIVINKTNTDWLEYLASLFCQASNDFGLTSKQSVPHSSS